MDGTHNTALGLTADFPYDQATVRSDGGLNIFSGQEKGEYWSSLKLRR